MALLHGRAAATGRTIANSSTQTTPILVDDLLVFCTPFNRMVALDPDTGRERWVYDPKVALDHALPYHYNCRGVSGQRDLQALPGSACATRVFMGTNDSRRHCRRQPQRTRLRRFGQRGQVRISRDVVRQVRG